jgi:rhodanese-related sulfurtransferase
MKRQILPFILSTLFATAAWGYDGDMAARIAPVFAKLDHAGLAKGGCKISSEDYLAMRAKKEKMTVLDVRTPAEARVVAMPGALHIPMDQLMKNENLDRLPTDGKIVVVCHSGSRAAAATALLKAVGFDNVTYVSGGLIALITATTPKALPVE